MRQLIVVFLMLTVAMVTAKPLHRNTKFFERALLSRLVSGRSADHSPYDCEMINQLQDALFWYFDYSWDLPEEQREAFSTLFPDNEQWLSCYYEPESEEVTSSEESGDNSTSASTQTETGQKSGEVASSEESAESSTFSPTPAETGLESEEVASSEESAESSTSSTPAETEATTSPQQSEASRRLLLDKLLRDLQINLKRREAFKHYNNKRRQ